MPVEVEEGGPPLCSRKIVLDRLRILGVKGGEFITVIIITV